MTNKINSITPFSYNVVSFIARKALTLMGDVLFSFPKSVRIEATNRCNARCVMCPRKEMVRPLGTMSYDAFTGILKQVPKGRRTIHFHNFGEPLLDKAIFDKIRLAKQFGFKTRMFSNLSLLTEEMVAELIRSGLDDLKVSIDAASADQYESIRVGLSFDTLNRNMKMLRDSRRADGRITPLITALFIDLPENTHEKEEFVKLYGTIADKVTIVKRHNWAGDGGKGEGVGIENASLPCLRIWSTLTVLWDGRIALCCMDLHGKVILGDLKKDSLIDIVKYSSVLRDIKKLHLEGRQNEIPLCRNCELRR
jgi:MoaA/NifB/PqqE/SkfB family radical SAM enzyme